MKLTNEYIHLKSDSNSILNGYWTSDIGGLNEVTHIWEYGIKTVHYTQFSNLSLYSDMLLLQSHHSNILINIFFHL